MIREQTLSVWQNRVRMRVLSDGSGPPLVYYHGPWGLTWDPFLQALAQRFTVYAPEHPGTSPSAHDDIYHLDNMWDLILCHEELLTALKLDEVAMTGHSFGAMVACEMAAAYPRRVKRLALIAPLGFWRDAEPVKNWMMVNPPDMPGWVFRDANSEAAKQMIGPSEPPDAAAAARVKLMWAMGATGKFIWPIPDKGLKKRIHRVTAPTLLVWGKDDRIVPPVYADEFTQRIPGARLQTVADAGHAPHVEQPQAVASMVGEFLGG
jgi:pimeloyl-ACP methyl ester carboxylesterase